MRVNTNKLVISLYVESLLSQKSTSNKIQLTRTGFNTTFVICQFFFSCDFREIDFTKMFLSSKNVL